MNRIQIVIINKMMMEMTQITVMLLNIFLNLKKIINHKKKKYKKKKKKTLNYRINWLKYKKN